ncbi:hypothetical protein ACOSQ4_006139 [Xanthoceras sorbifolium]
MSNEYDDYCAAWAIGGPTNPEDDSRTCVMFSISIHVSFIYVPQFQSTEEDEVGIDELVETEGEDKVFEVERDVLINEDDEEKSRSTIQDMLFSMDVPDRPWMVDKILGCARSMASDKVYANHKVLRMNVSISVVKEEELETEEEDTETGVRPASEASIDQLEMVRVEEQSTLVEQCGICLEEFSCFLEARRMPCSHIFHRHCIVDWLRIRNFCPLCRFQLN